MSRPAPSKRTEAIVGFFIPPACREQVLGDLHERYENSRQYLFEVVTTIPFVIASRIRRTTDPQLLLMLAFAMYISFVAAAWPFEGRTFLFEQDGFLRVAIPTIAGLVGVVLAAAYATPGRTRVAKAVREAVAAAGTAMLSQVALRGLSRELEVPWPVLIFGAATGALLVSGLLMLFPPGGNDTPTHKAGRGGTTMSNDAIQRKALQFRRRQRRRHSGYLAALFGIAAMALYFIVARPPGGVVSGSLLIGAALFVAFQVGRYGPILTRPRMVTVESYRAELVRERNSLHRIWGWYLWPLLCGLLACALFVPLARFDQPVLWASVAPFAVLSIMWCLSIARLVMRDARARA
jgi:hypothetical protein